MSRLFLIGGGCNEASYIRTFWRFIVAATAGEDQRKIAIVVATDPGQSEEERKEQAERAREPFQLFDPVRPEQSELIFASRDEPLTAGRLAAVQPTGVYVAGGRTGAYHEALCRDRGWLDWMLERKLPYAGFSAGAVLASERAIMGGWLIALQHANCEVAIDKCSEGIDFAEVREGLGLVPFPIDVHATQWGTLTRLMHLVGENVVPGGWAIDENTMLEIDGDELRVHGPNSAYRLRRLGDGSVHTDIFHAGTALRRADWQ